MWYTPDNGWKSCEIVEEAGASGTRTSIQTAWSISTRA